MEFIDLDNLIERNVPRPKPLLNHWLAPQNPFFWAINAPTGGGKTYSLIQLILQNYLRFDHLYLFIKDFQEDKWLFVLKFLNTINSDLFTVGRDASDIPNPDELEVEGTKLFIFDDFIADKLANETTIKDMFTRGRKKNCSIVYLTQSYFAMGKTLRLNCNYFSLFGVASTNELQQIAKDHAAEIGYDKFKQYYQTAMREKYGFLFIDKKTNQEELKYRLGYDRDIETGEKLIQEFE
jgi:hypothetical protein